MLYALESSNLVFPLSTTSHSNFRGNCQPYNFYLRSRTHARVEAPFFSLSRPPFPAPRPTHLFTFLYLLREQIINFVNFPLVSRIHLFVRPRHCSSLRPGRNIFKLCNKWPRNERSPYTVPSLAGITGLVASRLIALSFARKRTLNPLPVIFRFLSRISTCAVRKYIEFPRQIPYSKCRDTVTSTGIV